MTKKKDETKLIVDDVDELLDCAIKRLKYLTKGKTNGKNAGAALIDLQGLDTSKKENKTKTVKVIKAKNK